MTGDIPVRRGTQRPIVWNIKQPDGSPMDLTGYEVELVVRARGMTDLVKTRNDDLTVVDLDGSVTWLPTDEETSSLPLGRVPKWGLEWRAPGGESDNAGGFLVVSEHPNRD